MKSLRLGGGRLFAGKGLASAAGGPVGNTRTRIGPRGFGLVVIALAVALSLVLVTSEAGAASKASQGTTVSFSRTDYATPGAQSLYALVTGDFNGDGHPDLAALDDHNGGQVYMFLNKGGGTFKAPVIYNDGCNGSGTAESMVAGDYDWPQDGKLDVVVYCDKTSIGGSPDLEVLHGDGAGHFGTPQPYSFGATFVMYDIRQGRIEGYNALIWLAPSGDPNWQQLCFLRPYDFYNGLPPSCSYDPDHPDYPYPVGGALAVADYYDYPSPPEDNQEMFTYTRYGSDYRLAIYNYGGIGPNGYSEEDAPGLVGALIAVGDLDHSGPNDPDAGNDIVMVQNDSPASYAVYLPGSSPSAPGTPGNTYAATGSAMDYVYTVGLADFNGDGYPDLAELAFGDFNCGVGDVYLGIQVGDGAGNFGSPQTFCTEGNGGQDVNAMAIADFNGDGKPDVATLGNWSPYVSVQLNTTSTTAPSIASVSPNTLGQGGTRNVKVKGNNFQPGATASVSGTGLSVLSTSFVSSTKLSVKLQAASGAPVGARDVTVTTGGGSATCTGCLTIDPAPAPTSTSPNSGARGATLNVDIFGSNFQPGAFAKFGGKISVSTTFVSSTHLAANITIGATATTGPRAITVVNPDKGTGSCPACFTVTP